MSSINIDARQLLNAWSFLCSFNGVFIMFAPAAWAHMYCEPSAGCAAYLTDNVMGKAMAQLMGAFCIFHGVLMCKNQVDSKTLFAFSAGLWAVAAVFGFETLGLLQPRSLKLVWCVLYAVAAAGFAYLGNEAGKTAAAAEADEDDESDD